VEVANDSQRSAEHRLGSFALQHLAETVLGAPLQSFGGPPAGSGAFEGTG